VVGRSVESEAMRGGKGEGVGRTETRVEGDDDRNDMRNGR
jgi:hypothetical protein